MLNVNSQFSVTGTLLLFEDHASQTVTGEVTKNTIQAPNPVITTNLHVDGSNVYGTVNTTSQRQFEVAGFVNTSHGKINTDIRQNVSFNNEQFFNINTNEYVQNISEFTPVNSTVNTRGDGFFSYSNESFFYPLKVDITDTFPNGQVVQTTVVSQGFNKNESSPWFTSSVSR